MLANDALRTQACIRKNQGNNGYLSIAEVNITASCQTSPNHSNRRTKEPHYRGRSLAEDNITLLTCQSSNMRTEKDAHPEKQWPYQCSMITP